ncbi:MAG: hypothetical protein RL662_2300 [Bacteroidota bacterium]|jgi:hypothetical protein
MKTKIVLLFSSALMLLSGCSDSVLDRPPLTSPDDESYWISEDGLRFYANEYYPYFFHGYNVNWAADYTPVRGYTFNDDLTNTNVQTLFESSVPDARGSNNNTNATPPEWLAQYAGPTWYFGWIRKSNVMLDRIDNKMKGILKTEAYNHWTGIARFFRGLEYCRLTGTFGDTPYFEKLMATTDNTVLYKDRDARGVVMDKVYEDFKYALANVREKDQNQQYVNKYIVAGYVSRWMLFAGTWAKYHDGDTERAKKYLEFAKQAAEVIANSGMYAIEGDFRSLFGSEDLSANKECILFRHYDNAAGVRHCIASYCSGDAAQASAANLTLVKAFICNDGEVWQNSVVQHADSFNLPNLMKTRDPRFEASFSPRPTDKSATFLYSVKFISRDGQTYLDNNNLSKLPERYKSTNNTNDYPVLRYSEILLNWIEAKAELATLGGAGVTQADIDFSINDIRNRPLDQAAKDRGVSKTAAMQLAQLPNDPSRDADVSALIWEIRRERRMELFFEHSRLLDIKRWKKIQYMNGTTNPDNLKSVWVDFKREAPDLLSKTKIGKISVLNANGQVVTFDGTNTDQMVGFYIPENVKDRDAFVDRVYNSPVAKGQIVLYEQNGYKLTQTKGW